MKRVLWLLALVAAVGCDRSPSGPGPAPPPFDRTGSLAQEMSGDARMLELVGLSTLSVDELLALGYPVENLTPEHGADLLASLAASYGEAPSAALVRSASPFSPGYGPPGGLTPAEWPEWFKRLKEELARIQCDWVELYDATNKCGIAGAGAAALTGGAPAGYVVFGTCTVKVAYDNCSILERG